MSQHSTNFLAHQVDDEGRQAAAMARSFEYIGEIAAIYCDDFGWDVRPAREGDKLPIVPWSLTNAAQRLDPSVLYRHWYMNPRLNIAILTGSRSRLVVADIDNNPEKYATSVDERLALLFANDWPMQTCMERTGGGGLHVYAALPAGVKVRSVDAYLAPGIELKAEGRLVIAAPSATAKGPYAWLDGHDPWRLPPAPLPDAVLATLTIALITPSADEPQVFSALSQRELRRLGRIAHQFVQRAVERARDGIDGGRHNTGVWLACQLRDLRVSDELGLASMRAYQREVQALHG